MDVSGTPWCTWNTMSEFLTRREWKLVNQGSLNRDFTDLEVEELREGRVKARNATGTPFSGPFEHGEGYDDLGAT